MEASTGKTELNYRIYASFGPPIRRLLPKFFLEHQPPSLKVYTPSVITAIRKPLSTVVAVQREEADLQLTITDQETQLHVQPTSQHHGYAAPPPADPLILGAACLAMPKRGTLIAVPALLLNLYVLPDARILKLGTSLLSFLLGHVATNGRDAVIHIPESNLSACQFLRAYSRSSLRFHEYPRTSLVRHLSREDWPQLDWPSKAPSVIYGDWVRFHFCLSQSTKAANKQSMIEKFPLESRYKKSEK